VRLRVADSRHVITPVGARSRIDNPVRLCCRRGGERWVRLRLARARRKPPFLLLDTRYGSPVANDAALRAVGSPGRGHFLLLLPPLFLPPSPLDFIESRQALLEAAVVRRLVPREALHGGRLREEHPVGGSLKLVPFDMEPPHHGLVEC